jgi:hypothetical protein
MNYNISKYNYLINETDQQLYIFELTLKTINNENKIFRCIKKNYQGFIDINEDLLFNTINKFKLTVLNINSMHTPIVLKKIIDHSINSNTFLTNDIYLEINKTNDNLIEFNYNIRN